MPFKHNHIHSRSATLSTATADTVFTDNDPAAAASTSLPVASSSSSSSIANGSSQATSNNNQDANDDDSELSNLDAEDSDDDADHEQEQIDSNTIFKTRDVFEAYARIRFAATTQPTSRGAEKKNTPNVISMSCRNARSSKAVDQGTSCTWSMKAQHFEHDEGWKVIKDHQVHNAACIARASQFGKSKVKVKKEGHEDEELELGDMLGGEEGKEGPLHGATSAINVAPRRERLQKAPSSSEIARKTTSSLSNTRKKRAKSPDYSKMSFLFDKVYNLRRAQTVKKEETEDSLQANTPPTHLPQRRSTRITIAQSKYKIKQEEFDDFDYELPYHAHTHNRQASISSIRDRDDTPNLPITRNTALDAQIISSSSLSPISSTGSSVNMNTVSPRSSRSSSLTSLSEDSDSESEEEDSMHPVSSKMEVEEDEDVTRAGPFPALSTIPSNEEASDEVAMLEEDDISEHHTSDHLPLDPREERSAYSTTIPPKTVLTSPRHPHKRAGHERQGRRGGEPSSEAAAVNGALALAMLSKSPSPAAYESEEEMMMMMHEDSGYGMELDLELDLASRNE